MRTPAELAAEARQHYQQLEADHGLSALATRVHEDIRLVFIRGRAVEAGGLTPPTKLFSYPLPDICECYGRANIPNHPVLYVGETPAVIAEELRLPPDSWLHLAVFYTPKPVRFEYLLLLHDALDSANTWAAIRDDLREKLTLRVDLPEPSDKIWSRLQSVAMLFRHPDHTATSVIAHHWLYERGVDAVLYPSVRNDRWCNFAIHPRFADALKQSCVLACRWTGSKIELHHTGTPDGAGNLHWRATTHEDWQQFNSTYSHLRNV